MGQNIPAGCSDHFFKLKAAVRLLFFYIVLPVTHCYGQSYFYFESKLTNSTGHPLSYYIFLTIETDGSATGRIRYIDPVSGQDRLIEQHFSDSSVAASTDSTNPVNKYLISTGDPYLIMGTDDSTFIVPFFVFQKQDNSQESFYAPVGIEYKKGDGNLTMAEMIANQQKSYAELTRAKDLVSRFFSQSDNFYKYLFAPDTRALGKLERKTKMFIIAVANTKDSLIGITAQKDLDKITGTFTTMAAQLGIPIKLIKISGIAFNKSGVEAALRGLKPSPIDIVVFYYSGHGFRYTNDTSKYPRISLRASAKLDLDKNNLGMEDIYKRILKKGARVNIVLGDCCNEDIGAPVPVGRDPLHTRGIPGAKINIDNCKALFFPDHPVSILTSSAEINQRAAGNPALGGFFTNFFNAGLINSLYGDNSESSWLRILLIAKESARKQALTALCDEARCVQRAEISVIPPQ